MDRNAARGHLFEMTRGLNELFCPIFVKRSLGAHASNNTTTTHSNISIFMGQKDRGADPLISTAGRVCAVYAG